MIPDHLTLRPDTKDRESAKQVFEQNARLARPSSHALPPLRSILDILLGGISTPR